MCETCILSIFSSQRVFQTHLQVKIEQILPKKDKFWKKKSQKRPKSYLKIARQVFSLTWLRSTNPKSSYLWLVRTSCTSSDIDFQTRTMSLHVAILIKLRTNSPVPEVARNGRSVDDHCGHWAFTQWRQESASVVNVVHVAHRSAVSVRVACSSCGACTQGSAFYCGGTKSRIALAEIGMTKRFLTYAWAESVSVIPLESKSTVS